MKNPFFLSRIVMLLILSGACTAAFSQSTADPASSSPKVYHHWHSVSPGIHLPSAAEGAYRNLPQTDYTPAQNILEWSAKKDIESFAAQLAGKLSALYVMSVDETGYVRKVKTIKTNDAKSAAALSAIILNTKISGPSFIHNQAVAAYVPCSISVTNNQITIL